MSLCSWEMSIAACELVFLTYVHDVYISRSLSHFLTNPDVSLYPPVYLWIHLIWLLSRCQIIPRLCVHQYPLPAWGGLDLRENSGGRCPPRGLAVSPTSLTWDTEVETFLGAVQPTCPSGAATFCLHSVQPTTCSDFCQWTFFVILQFFFDCQGFWASFPLLVDLYKFMLFSVELLSFLFELHILFQLNYYFELVTFFLCSGIYELSSVSKTSIGH